MQDDTDPGPKAPGWAAKAILGAQPSESYVTGNRADEPVLGDPGGPCVLVTMTRLSTVLHELVGEASMCWDPKPTGVFASARALKAVAQALERLSTNVPEARRPAQAEPT